MMEVKIALFQTHPHVAALHTLNLICLPAVAGLCIWHAIEGRRPLLGQSEIHTSIILGVLSAFLAFVLTFIGLGYRHQRFQLLFAVPFYAAAAFYLLKAFHERHSDAATY